jgi:hypothetical protein
MDIDELVAKQNALGPLAERMANEKDPDEILRLAAQLTAKAKELEKAALAIAAAATPPGPRNVGGELRIQLTPDQRKRVAEQTGVGVETLELSGAEAQAWELKMQTMQKHIVERRALQIAANRIADAAMKKTVKDVIELMENIPDPPDEVKEAIQVLKEEGQPGLEELAKRQVARAEAAKQRG